MLGAGPRCAIYDAVSAWYTDRAATEAKYGPIEQWNVEAVTDMHMLFCGGPACAGYHATGGQIAYFNEDLSAWFVFLESQKQNLQFWTCPMASAKQGRCLSFQNVFEESVYEGLLDLGHRFIANEVPSNSP